ncbi:MAG TPA: DUF3618 domain-containing protein [Jatrophihabitantaceae bacterium]|jgi:ElaB/YqjD/DUF883 family membrane-anchored ribosome-binding protein
MTTPDQIQSDIERTRSQLSSDVDRLNEKVSPGKVMNRRVHDVKNHANSLRDRVMGSADDNSGLRGAGDSISSGASSVASAASDAPQAVRRQAQGNPLAAGLIAFGVGWLLSSLAPATEAEQQLATQAESKAQDLAEPLKQAGQELADDLKQPLQESVEQIKQTAADAGQQTADQAKSAADDVKAPMQQ